MILPDDPLDLVSPRQHVTLTHEKVKVVLNLLNEGDQVVRVVVHFIQIIKYFIRLSTE